MSTAVASDSAGERESQNRCQHTGGAASSTKSHVSIIKAVLLKESL
jgi:hypothetical protein